MAWAKPQYSKRKVDEAGRVLLWTSDEIWRRRAEYEQGLQIVSNWRSCHSFPLNTLQVTLRRRARQLDLVAIVAQRLKRLTSIEAKLRRQTTRLSQMQDLGGCRAVLSNADQVAKLHQLYRAGDLNKSLKWPHELAGEDDYIAHPKSDGYRSVHLVYRFLGRANKESDHKGLLIEVQLRSRLQHAWATAVETATTFTGQALKWRGGRQDWQRFFVLMASAIALREKCAVVPNTPSNKQVLIGKLRRLAKELNVERVLAGWSTATQVLLSERAPADAQMFLLRLDTVQNRLFVTAFRSDERQGAVEQYLAAEKDVDEKPSSQVVLVSVDSVEALRSAYPNYYVDTAAFLDALREAIA